MHAASGIVRDRICMHWPRKRGIHIRQASLYRPEMEPQGNAVQFGNGKTWALSLPNLDDVTLAYLEILKTGGGISKHLKKLTALIL